MTACVVPQVSVFVPNRRGMLLKVLDAIGGVESGILCCSLPESECFGVLRVLFRDVASRTAAIIRLRAAGLCTLAVDVLLVEGIPWTSATAALSDAGLDIAYMYAFGKSLVLRVCQEKIEDALIILVNAGRTAE